MIPLKDENPTRSPAVLTILIIAACVGIYFLVQPTGQATVIGQTAESSVRELEFNLENAAIPCEVVEGRPLTEREIIQTFEGDDANACDSTPSGRTAFPGKNVWLAVVYSMFLHGSLLHLGGNMLYLWVFGNNIEDKAGKPVYVVFYLLSGLAATAAHIALQPSSTVPLVGASGAIAGVMGAYLVLFPRAPIKSLIIFFFILFREIEARWLLGFWFVSQFFISPNSGVAWAAHVGGFVFGVLAGLVWKATGRSEPTPSPYPSYPPYPPYR